MGHCVHLTVQQPRLADVYRDRIRVPVLHRGAIREGGVCRLSVKGKALLVEVRGIRLSKSNPNPGTVIQIDEVTRAKLGLQLGSNYQFEFKEVGIVGEFLWAWRASAPTPRIAARLGIIGIVLGLIALGIGLLPHSK
jgi:hypothetical protein